MLRFAIFPNDVESHSDAFHNICPLAFHAFWHAHPFSQHRRICSEMLAAIVILLGICNHIIDNFTVFILSDMFIRWYQRI